MSSILSAKAFQDENAAYPWVEARVWPDGPTCPHCGALKEHIGKLAGKSTRPGVYKCYACRKPFTVKVGTVFESSHVPLRLWLQAMYLMYSSKKGVSSNQLHRILGVTLKTAWFMSHRIRLAMPSWHGAHRRSRRDCRDLMKPCSGLRRALTAKLRARALNFAIPSLRSYSAAARLVAFTSKEPEPLYCGR